MEEKEKAVAYIKEHNIATTLQKILNNLYIDQPANVYGYLSDKIKKFARQPSINLLSGYSVKSYHDDLLRTKIEVKCNVNNHTEIIESTVVGHDGGDAMTLDELKAVNDVLLGQEIDNQEYLDNKLKGLEISTDMVLTVSVAIFKSYAKLQNKPMLTLLLESFNTDKLSMPVPVVTLLSGGKHGPGKNNIFSLAIAPNLATSYNKGMETIEKIVKKIEEILKKKYPNNLPNIAPNGAFSFTSDKVEAMFELVKEASTELELTPGQDFSFVLDCKANDFHTEVVPGQGSAKKGQTQSTSRHRYDWIEGQVKASEDLCDMLEGLLETESIVALVDPLHNEDDEGYERLAQKIGGKCLLFSRIDTANAGSVVRLNYTVSDTVAKLRNCEGGMLEAAQLEEGETVIADMALTSGCDVMMLGGLHGIRRQLYNQLATHVQQHQVQPKMNKWVFKKLQSNTADADESTIS